MYTHFFPEFFVPKPNTQVIISDNLCVITKVYSPKLVQDYANEGILPWLIENEPNAIAIKARYKIIKKLSKRERYLWMTSKER